MSSTSVNIWNGHGRLYLTRSRPVEVAGLLGYHRTTVNSWAAGAKSRLGKLPSIQYFGETVFAKEHLTVFLVSTVNIGYVEKSVKHRALIKAYRQNEENQMESAIF